MAVRRLHPDQPAHFAFTPENMAWAQNVIAKYPQGKQASAIIPLLWRAQEQHNGWLPEPAIRYVTEMLGMAHIRGLEVATFYTMFQLAPVGSKAHVQVCGTTPCMLRGAEDLKGVCKRRIAEHQHELNADGTLSWEEVECLGNCANAPMVQIDKDTFEDLTPALLENVIDGFLAGTPPKPGSQIGRTASCPEGGPTSLQDPSLYDGSVIGSWRARFDAANAAAAAAAATGAPAGVAPAAAAAAAPATAPAAAAPAAGPGATAGTAGGAAAVNPAALTAMANAGLVKELEARGGGKALSADELSRLKAQAGVAGAPAGGAGAGAAGAALGLAGAGVASGAAAAAGTGAGAASGDASVSGADKPELLSAPRDGKGDELGLIWGVGDKLADKMNAMGIWHFDQIAKWTPANVAWFEASMDGFKGRIDRDKWIEQCIKLAAGWRPDGNVGERPKG